MIHTIMANMNKPISIDLPLKTRSRIYIGALLLVSLSVPFAHLYMAIDLSLGELIVHSLDICLRFLLLLVLVETCVYAITRRKSWILDLSLIWLWLGLIFLTSVITGSIYLAPYLLPLGESIYEKHLQAGYADMPLRSLPVGLLIAYLLLVYVRRDIINHQLAELKVINQELEKLQHQIKPIDLYNAPQFLIVHEKQEILVNPRYIFRIQSDENYCQIYVCEDGRQDNVDCYLIRRTLSDVLTELPTDLFVHSHRSHIVNLRFVSKIIRDGRNRKLCMNNADTIPISRGKLSEVQEKLHNFTTIAR